MARLIAITGIPGTGMNTMAQLMYELVPANSKVCVSVESILDGHMKRETIIGIELKRQKQIKEPGFPYRDDLIVPALRNYFRGLDKQVEELFVSGFPRTDEQIKLLKLFKSVSVFQLRASQDHVHLPDPAIRQKFVRNALQAHSEETLPALEKIQPLLTRLNRSKSINDRLGTAICALYPNDERGFDCLDRLGRDQALQARIRKIEGFMPTDTPVKFAVT